MYRTVSARINANGEVKITEPLTLDKPHEALVVIMEPAEPTTIRIEDMQREPPTRPRGDGLDGLIGQRRRGEPPEQPYSPYALMHQLNSGGQADIFVGVDVRDYSTVCVKRVRGLGEDLRSVYQEHEAMIRLEHPYIARVLDLTVIEGDAALVMEYIPGPTLGELMTSNRCIFEPLAIALACQLFEAMAYCHARGVVHRDLKPNNVIVQRDRKSVV
jgi:serine/threonine protein kinase